MINSLDRISVATSDLERSKKTFNDFFDSSPAFEVEEKNIGYKSLIYNFENCFQIFKFCSQNVSFPCFLSFWWFWNIFTIFV